MVQSARKDTVSADEARHIAEEAVARPTALPQGRRAPFDDRPDQGGSQAYIRSQAWTSVRSKYDDGGFSSGNTDEMSRPIVVTACMSSSSKSWEP